MKISINKIEGVLKHSYTLFYSKLKFQHSAHVWLEEMVEEKRNGNERWEEN